MLKSLSKRLQMKVKKLMLQLRIFTNDEIRVDAEMGHKYIDVIVSKGHFLNKHRIETCKILYLETYRICF